VTVRLAFVAGFSFVAMASAAACGSFDEGSGKAEPEPERDAASEGSVPIEGGSGDAAPERSATYRAAILADEPVAYWRMGHVESAIIIPNERTPGTNDLSLSGGPDFQTGAPGIFDDDHAVRFGGNGGHALASASTAIAFLQAAPFTVELWARRERDAEGDAGEYFQQLFSYVEGYSTPAPSTQNGYFVYLRLGDPIGTYASYGSLSGGAVEARGKLPPIGEWAHYAMVFDGTMVTLFIDAQQQAQIATKGVFAPRTVPFTLARASNENLRFFNGSIDEVAVYAQALPVATLAKHVAIVRGP
jgi:hypothetical protein